jgi:hypothetical protein
MTAPPALDVLYDDKGWRVAIAKNVLFTGIADGPQAEALAAVARAQRRLLSYDGAVAGFTVIVGMRVGMLTLDEESRAEIGRMMRVPNLRGHSVIAIESPGFAGVTVRSLLSAIILLSRPESPQKVVDSKVDGARYLAHHAGIGWSASDLVHVAYELTRDLEPRVAS